MTRAALPGICLLLVFVGAHPALAQATPPPQAADKVEALGTAARQGDVATVKKLLDEGVDVNSKFRYGVTALSFAADHGHADVVKLLIERGADVNAKDTFYKATPLTWASSPASTRTPEHAVIVGLLLKAGATGKDDALLSAVSEPDLAMTKVILAFGGFSADTLADALDAAKPARNAELTAALEAAGARPRPELTMTEAELTAYVGTYRLTNGNELVIRVTAGKLTVGAGEKGNGPTQPIALVPRNVTTFGAPDAPGLIVTFKIENGKVTAMIINGATYTKAGGTR